MLAAGRVSALPPHLQDWPCRQMEFTVSKRNMCSSTCAGTGGHPGWRKPVRLPWK
uniref:Uncharacterized protein n=1 Tax=Arundo donax TaxID=35708 RepID=A0A0A9ELR0_ARUDO